MSILLSTVFPLALSGVGLPVLAAQAAPVASPAPVLTQPVTPAKPVLVKVTPKPAAKTVPAIIVSSVPVAPVAGQPAVHSVQLIQIQNPAPAPPAATAALDRNAIIDGVGKALTEVRTAQGKFSQIDPSGGVSSGAFYINRPGKVRFAYDKPEPMFIVSDGVSVSIEEPKRDSYDAVPLSSTPLHLFLRSNVDLRRDGSVTDVKTANGSHFVTLVDKTGEAQGKMILEFRASDFELMGWRALDGDGAETRLKLSDTKRNVSLKPSLFVVKDPEDAEHR